jgi:hypothetical protein
MWKEAFFNDKVYCPHQRCTNKTSFFNEASLEQHLFILQDSAGPLEIVTFPWHNEGLRRRQCYDTMLWKYDYETWKHD